MGGYLKTIMRILEHQAPEDPVECLKRILEQVLDGVIECRSCGNDLMPDVEKCRCGWVNPLLPLGVF